MTVSKKIILGATLAAMVGSVVVGGISGASAKDRGEKGPRAMIIEMDENKNGAIELKEFQGFLDTKFKEADANNDQMVEGKEIAYNLDGRRGKHMAKRAVKMFDANGDRKISKSELDDRGVTIFAFFDVNKDGKIEKSEMPNRGKFKKHHKEMKKHMKQKEQKDQN